MFEGGLVGSISRALYSMGAWLSPTAYAPETSLTTQPMRDPRLVPKAPMSNGDIDAGTLAALSKAGMMRGKLVTHESHPELMGAWETMAKRAGIPPPQLIIADSKVPNAAALMIHKPAQEVVISNSLLQRLDLRETLGVLGHELGHSNSDHSSPRLLARAALGLGGFWGGLMLGRTLKPFTRLDNLVSKVKPIDWVIGKTLGPQQLRQMKTDAVDAVTLGSIGSFVGNIAAAHLTVRPTELDADSKGAAISGDPQGLALALRQLESHRKTVHPVKQFLAKALSGYPSTQERVSRLEEIHQRQGSQPLVPGVEQLAPSAPVERAPVMGVMPQMPTPPSPAPVTHVQSASLQSRLAVGAPTLDII